MIKFLLKVKCHSKSFGYSKVMSGSCNAPALLSFFFIPPQFHKKQRAQERTVGMFSRSTSQRSEFSDRI